MIDQTAGPRQMIHAAALILCSAPASYMRLHQPLTPIQEIEDWWHDAVYCHIVAVSKQKFLCHRQMSDSFWPRHFPEETCACCKVNATFQSRYPVLLVKGITVLQSRA